RAGHRSLGSTPDRLHRELRFRARAARNRASGHRGAGRSLPAHPGPHRSHPAGILGRRLLLHVKDVMRTGADIPTVRADTPLAEGLMEMSRKRLGMTAIVDETMRVLGVFTDGDLRR